MSFDDLTDTGAVQILRQLADNAIVKEATARADFYLWLARRLGHDAIDTRPRCRRCGQPFEPNHMGRPRLDCQGCSPSR